jgi:hypothetical protein
MAAEQADRYLRAKGRFISVLATP